MTTTTPLVRKVQDVLERAVSTYVQVFAGLLVAANVGMTEIADLSVIKTCAVSAVPAFLSVIKSLAAINLPVGDTSASLLSVGYETIKRVEYPIDRPVEVIKYVERTVKKSTAATTKVDKSPAVTKPATKKAK